MVCAVYFTPVAGYIPDRPVIKYLAAERNMEIAFVPIAGTRILVPFRMTIPTPFGPAMLEATQFVTIGDAAAGGEDAVEASDRLAPVSPRGEVGAKRRVRGSRDSTFELAERAPHPSTLLPAMSGAREREPHESHNS